jgi:uncharacterized LabA/DUF88 family protein
MGNVGDETIRNVLTFAAVAEAAIGLGLLIVPSLLAQLLLGEQLAGIAIPVARILVRAFYYTAIIEDQEYSSIRPLIDWLDYNGYTVVTKFTKEFIDAATGRRKVKGSMDVELAVNAMELAEHVDQIVLFSGDGDFRPLVEAVQRRGVRVTVVSTLASQPPMVADELRRQADAFIDLAELKPKLGRASPERPVLREARQQLPRLTARGTINPGDRVE